MPDRKNPRLVSFTRLPGGVQQAGIARIEFKSKHGTVTDLVHVPEAVWRTAHWRFEGVRDLVETPGPQGPEVKRLANLYSVSERTHRKRTGKAPFRTAVGVQRCALTKRDRCTRAHYGTSDRDRSSATPNA